MPKDRWRKFFIKSKKLYYSIGFLISPALNLEKVYFSHDGLKHLLMKNNKYRTIKDQIRRLKLLTFVIDIISNSKKFDKYRIINNTQYWSLYKHYKNKTVTIIIRKLGDQKIQFYSIMDKKHTSSN